MVTASICSDSEKIMHMCAMFACQKGWRVCLQYSILSCNVIRPVSLPIKLVFLWTQSPEKYSCVRFPSSTIIHREGYLTFLREHFYDYSVGMIQVQYKLIITVNWLIIATKKQFHLITHFVNHSAIMYLQWKSMELHR